MVSAQPGKQSACVDDDTGMVVATGFQQPPMECHRNCSRAQQGGKHSTTFSCLYEGEIRSVRSKVCTGKLRFQLSQRLLTAATGKEGALLVARVKESEVKILCYCTPE